MAINLYEAAIQILEQIANSLHDHPKERPFICFNEREVKILEGELRKLLEDKKC